VAELLADSAARRQLGAAARGVIESHRGVIKKMVEEVGHVL
jgi:hypothetical protein